MQRGTYYRWRVGIALLAALLSIGGAVSWEVTHPDPPAACAGDDDCDDNEVDNQVDLEEEEDDD
jgi:hypothetical protein